MRVRAAAICALLTFFGCAQVKGAGIIFRYLPGADHLSSPIESSGVEPGPFLDERELPARRPGGWGLAPPWAAEFEAPSSVIRSVSEETISQPLGPQLTIEVWTRAFEIPQVIHLLGNQSHGEGFLLGVESGMAFIDFAFAGTTHRIYSRSLLEENRDYWLAATIRKEGGGVRLRLFLNGVEQANEVVPVSVSGAYPIGRPFLVGSRIDSGSEMTGTLTGLIYAAVVRDYAAAEVYLTSPPPFDGSTYFGLTEFHDYPLEGFHLPMDQRIDPSPVEIQMQFALPYANDEYVPQGTAVHTEIAGEDTTKLVYVSFYHLTRTGVTGLQNSIVTEVDAATGAVRRTFRLMGRLATSHAGGIAFAGDAIFVSSAGYLERYPLPEYDGENGPRYIDLEADNGGSIFVASKASFVSEFNDTLWVGDWRTARDVAPYLYGYALDDRKLPIAANPVVYALPRNIQGVDFFESGGDVFLFMSRNRNNTEAELLRYRPSQLDLYAVREPDSVITMPHGIEDLAFFEDGSLWTNSESGADYYQKGPNPWPIFYPFVYGVPPDVLFPNWTSTGVEKPADFNHSRMKVFPNPASGLTTIQFDHAVSGGSIRVYDLLGRAVETVTRDVTAEKIVRWDSSAYVPGTYFIVFENGAVRHVEPVSISR